MGCSRSRRWRGHSMRHTWGRHRLLRRRGSGGGGERQRPAGHRGRGARGDRAQGRGALHAAARGAHRARARTGARAAPQGDARRQGARAAGAFRMIRIHNSLSGEKQELRPITPGSLRMYVCGLTVYDYVHIGHARMLLVFDVVSRYLRHRGYRLTYVRNITDIDDKIIRRATENGEPIGALTERFIAAMNEDCGRLGIARPDHEPRATQYVPQIIAMVARLLAKDYAYVAASGDEFVNLWMHNGFVNVDEEKMSKSLGNFFTLREVLPALRHPEVLRFFVLSSHYRGPINYSLEQLEQADAALGRIYTALRDLPAVAGAAGAHTTRFLESMDDDFNTPEALAVLQNLTREVNSARDAGDVARAAQLAAELRALGGVLGLLGVEPAQWFRLAKPTVGRRARETGAAEGGGAGLSDEEIEARIAARSAAGRAKHWAESDRIRDELAAAGVLLEDKPGGKTAWRRA